MVVECWIKNHHFGIDKDLGGGMGEELIFEDKFTFLLIFIQKKANIFLYDNPQKFYY